MLMEHKPRPSRLDFPEGIWLGSPFQFWGFFLVDEKSPAAVAEGLRHQVQLGNEREARLSLSVWFPVMIMIKIIIVIVVQLRLYQRRGGLITRCPSALRFRKRTGCPSLELSSAVPLGSGAAPWEELVSALGGCGHLAGCRAESPSHLRNFQSFSYILAMCLFITSACPWRY